MADTPRYELVMFMRSHFNEKARWALDWKGVPHRRTPLLPGPHVGTVKKLTGQTMVPVLIVDGTPIAGSDRIIDELERRHPEPPLYPVDPGERARALEIQKFFDDEIGPKIRRAFFSVAIETPSYVTSVFASHKNAVIRALYGGIFPLVKGKMKRDMQVFEPHIGEAFEGTRQGFDFVAGNVGPSGYLVGNRFSVADLAAAALLAPGVDLQHPDMRKPDPKPEGVRAFLDRWADHPGADWVREIYARDRPGRAAEA